MMPANRDPSSSPEPIPSSQPVVDDNDAYAFTSPTDSSKRAPVLPAFSFRNFLTRRTSAEILTDLERTDRLAPSPRPSTPTPTTRRRQKAPMSQSHPSTPEFRTPESSSNHSIQIGLEASPSSSRSKRSVDTEGDVKMLNGVFTTPERRQIQQMQQRDELRGMVIQSVHDNFEFEWSRLVDEVGRQVLALLGDEVEWSVRERVDRVLCAAIGEPAESELEQIVAVRERLRRMSDEARLRVFCTEEMARILRRLADVVDLEMRMEAWTLVGGNGWD